MILQSLYLKIGKFTTSYYTRSWAKPRICLACSSSILFIRYYGDERAGWGRRKEEFAKELAKDMQKQRLAKKEAQAIEKDFFVSVLNSSTTKREAKSYIQRFTPSKDSAALTPTLNGKSRRIFGVNLGACYGLAAVERSPKFEQIPAQSVEPVQETQLHVALVKIRAPQTLNDETIDGIGRTLTQLERLGLTGVVVVDCNLKHGPSAPIRHRDARLRKLETEQANRIIRAIDSYGKKSARLVDQVISINENDIQATQGPIETWISNQQLLWTPLRRGAIPVLPSVGYTDATHTVLSISSSDVIMALTREFLGIRLDLELEEDPYEVQRVLQKVRDEISVDRLIILDPLGGIPALDQPVGYHVFLNMEQEFESAKGNLLKGCHDPGRDSSESQTSQTDSCNFLSSSVNSTLATSHTPSRIESGENLGIMRPENWIHVQNLELTRCVLSMLPPSSSALLTTPEEAANSEKDTPFQPARVGTRRQPNPLIHNLLTDKPAFSSSLPAPRGKQRTILTESHSTSTNPNVTPTTFAKHGMSVAIFPNPALSPWTPPSPGKPAVSLTDSQIDLLRLVHLIEDSFGRTLDLPAYLARVNTRIAGVIIAGAYEGGALLTWETPPGVDTNDASRMVPYLDKFAVLQRSQGSGGVADLIFKAMVRDCFPHGVVWRSRKNNPVNKWYFERSRGTWKLPDTDWTMFWTTPESMMNHQLFRDYEGVCRGIEPSWSDGKR